MPLEKTQECGMLHPFGTNAARIQGRMIATILLLCRINLYVHNGRVLFKGYYVVW